MPTSAILAVDPPLGDRAGAVLAELGGHGPGPRRIWSGQPRGRSPWRADRGGHLVLDADGHEDGEALAWLRFLLREVLSPRSAGGLARARAVGVTTTHRVSGTLLLEDDDGLPVRVQVSGHRVSARSVRVEGWASDGPGPAS